MARKQKNKSSRRNVLRKIAGSGLGVVGAPLVMSRPGAAEFTEFEDVNTYVNSQIRPDGLNREVHLEQGMTVGYHGISDFTSSTYSHEFTVTSHGATRFSYQDEDFRVSHQAQLDYWGFEISSDYPVDFTDGGMTASAVPQGSATTATEWAGRTAIELGVKYLIFKGAGKVLSSVVRGGLEGIVGSSLRARILKHIGGRYFPNVLPEEQDSSPTYYGRDISDKWTARSKKNYFGFSGEPFTDQSMTLNFKVVLPQSVDISENDLSIRTYSIDDKSREISVSN